jgi:hypothetical protein
VATREELDTAVWAVDQRLGEAVSSEAQAIRERVEALAADPARPAADLPALVREATQQVMAAFEAELAGLGTRLSAIEGEVQGALVDRVSKRVTADLLAALEARERERPSRRFLR